MLEEAAGITGLHARRHEAELKLRAAEANLSRAEDLRGQLDTQLGSLRKQARQRQPGYRNISGDHQGEARRSCCRYNGPSGGTRCRAAASVGL